MFGGGGTVSTTGVFKAAATPGGSYTLTASSSGLQATASITVYAAPTIATPASVSANPITGTGVNGSVLGADDAGESALTYTWSATGPAAVSFSSNASNAAKTTSVAFAKPGSYVLKAVAKDAQALTASSSVAVPVTATPTRVVVTPATVALDPLQTCQFTAAAFDQFDVSLTKPARVYLERPGVDDQRLGSGYRGWRCRRVVYGHRLRRRRWRHGHASDQWGALPVRACHHSRGGNLRPAAEGRDHPSLANCLIRHPRLEHWRQIPRPGA